MTTELISFVENKLVRLNKQKERYSKTLSQFRSEDTDEYKMMKKALNKINDEMTNFVSILNKL